ncbi:MAG TPA: hypothetical protein VEY30_11300, partial [Myxococcaceae bacterium]|nr:hypothetical protein [Myxococcaceae bacterium]
VHPQTVRELKLLLGLFENGLGNLLLGGRPRPFTAMVAEEQDRVLGEWRDSRLTFRRSGYQGLRGLVTATYYAAPETWAAVGYPGPPGRGAR